MELSLAPKLKPLEMNLDLPIFFQKGCLVDLYIGRWAATKKLRPGDMLTGIDEDAFHPGHKKLLPKKALEKLITIEGKARTLLSKKSLEFPVGGGRFVYNDTWTDLLKSLEDLKSQWEAEVSELVLAYPSLKDTQLKLLDEQTMKLAEEDLKKAQTPDEKEKRWQMLQSWISIQKAHHRSLYPPSDQVASKFPFRWRVFQVAPPHGLSAEDINAANEELKQELNAWVREATKAMHKSLGEAATQARVLLQKQGKLNPKNLKPLFDAFETFKAIDFTGASDFQSVVDEMKKKYGIESQGNLDFEAMAASLNYNDQAKEEFGNLLSQVGELALDNVAEEAGLKAISRVGEFTRFVDVG